MKKDDTIPIVILPVMFITLYTMNAIVCMQ